MLHFIDKFTHIKAFSSNKALHRMVLYSYTASIKAVSGHFSKVILK